MACTAAVEDVIDEHYAGQIEKLGDSDDALKKTVAEFRAEEIEHKDTALKHGAEQAPAYRLFSGAVKAGCRLAIALSTRIRSRGAYGCGVAAGAARAWRMRGALPGFSPRRFSAIPYSIGSRGRAPNAPA